MSIKNINRVFVIYFIIVGLLSISLSARGYVSYLPLLMGGYIGGLIAWIIILTLTKSN